jgi:hypothetical protein
MVTNEIWPKELGKTLNLYMKRDFGDEKKKIELIKHKT